MRYLIRLVPPKGGNFLTTLRAIAGSMGVEVRNPKRTSYGALEVDVFVPTRSDFDLFLAALAPLSRLEFSRDLNVAPPHASDEELLTEARAYFNSERYWECHEVLEGLWRRKEGEEKSLLQGLILVCAAFVHHQKLEEAVARSVLGRAAKQLTYSSPEYHGIGMDSFRGNVARMLESGAFSEFEV